MFLVPKIDDSVGRAQFIRALMYSMETTGRDLVMTMTFCSYPPTHSVPVKMSKPTPIYTGVVAVVLIFFF